jgi:glycosyltransferase involved in cell wall biosynthesis
MNPPRRVLMTADPIGGVWTYALELARQFSRLQIELGLATMGAPLSVDQRQELARIPRVTLFETEYMLEWMDRPWEDVDQSGEWLLDLADRFQPDVVHLNGFAHGALPWAVPRVVVAHSCRLTWWEAVRRTAPPLELEEYRSRVLAGLLAADAVIAPTAAMLASVVRHYGPLPHTSAIWNARWVDGYAPDTKWPFILAAGRVWDEAKNIGALDIVAPTLRWPVLVAGETAAPGGSDTPMRHVATLGAVSANRLRGLMSHAAIYALPARYEPFGLSILEAALSGCALVLGDIDSLRELWNGVALFVDPDDEIGLGEVLRWLAEHTEAREVLARRARARALSRTPEDMARAYIGCYSEVRGLNVA